MLSLSVVTEYLLQQADQGLEQTLPPPTASETQPRQEVEHVLVKEEEKEVGVVAFGVYRAYWSAVGNILAPTILLSLFLMQGRVRMITIYVDPM